MPALAEGQPQFEEEKGRANHTGQKCKKTMRNHELSIQGKPVPGKPAPKKTPRNPATMRAGQANACGAGK